ncbi:MAG: twin-arginine translocase subunit TatC [Kofleriaceae bacterium]
MADDEDDPVKDEAELEGGRMPFLSHLVELRDRLRNAAIAFAGAFLVCWYFAEEIFAWLTSPVFRILHAHCNTNYQDLWHKAFGVTIPQSLSNLYLAQGAGDSWQCTARGLTHAQNWGAQKMVFTGLTQPFWVDMSIGLWAGIFVASPLIFYQLWKFIAPGLYKKERRYTVSFAIFSAVFFVCGALFCFYFALPKLFDFFLGYNSESISSMLTMQEYLDLTRDSMLAFGAIFEMPLLIYFLAMVGLVTHRSLWKFSRWFIVLAFIIGAVLTPGPDVVSQFMMATPMIVLYNISILLAWRVTVRRERKAKALEGKYQ